MYPDDPRQPNKLNRLIEVVIIIFSAVATAYIIWDAVDRFMN